MLQQDAGLAALSAVNVCQSMTHHRTRVCRILIKLLSDSNDLVRNRAQGPGGQPRFSKATCQSAGLLDQK